MRTDVALTAEVSPAKCAVLVVDLQNAFCTPSGSQAPTADALTRYAAVIEQAAELCRRARRQGIGVIFTRHTYRPGYPELAARGRIAQVVRELRGLERGSWDAEVVGALTPLAQDVVLDKSNFDAFLDTELDAILRAGGVRELIVLGVSTNVCVESTVRTAAQRGYDVLVASDATAATSEQLHEASLRSMAYLFARVIPWRDAPALAAAPAQAN